VRFCGAVALNYLLNSRLSGKFRDLPEYLFTEDGTVLIVSLVQLLFSDPNIHIREEIGEAIASLIKQFDEEIQGIFVRQVDFIEGACTFLDSVAKEIKFLKHEYSALLETIISCLSILNAEVPFFRRLFVDCGGIDSVLKIVEFYSN
jgi:hypothetical protein